MKKLLLFLVVVAVGIYFWVKSLDTATPEPSTTAVLAPSSTPAETPPVKTPKSASKAIVTAKAEESGVVAFEVKEGYAVVTHDMIIGKPEDPNLKKGHTHMPSVQTWDTPEIPYLIDSRLEDPDRVRFALRRFSNQTGLKFVPFDNQPDAILFQTGKKHCMSALGRNGGIQPILISPSCGPHEIMHEVMHALGFIHEQSRADRDQFVEVLWENVEPGFEKQFAILSPDYQPRMPDSIFDYHSIMLYDPRIFAKEKGELTMRSKTTVPIAPSANLSPGDVARVKKLFDLD